MYMLAQMSRVQHLAYTSDLSETSTNFMAVFSTSGCHDKSKDSGLFFCNTNKVIYVEEKEIY